ncbi:hypothetical protein U5903_04185 [Cereibacter johrii]|uniref:hypothetical protein n=1 Tax=Cereibacter johrii TaxID=445629 RepID=UPI002B25A68B|nr:hypothetical protein [Cereibacter johrii]MEA5159967.1 hypothetical protein [Cereibacter johrii]
MSVGMVYFAWVEDGEVFSPTVHTREDEQLFSLNISEKEGEFAIATIEIRNPRKGLLSPIRKQRCHISAEIDGTVMLLFSGRALGIPVSLGRETCEVEFVGRPDDWQSVQADFVESLKADPRYHPALVAEEDRSDLTAVLEGYSALPRWDRVTGELSLAALTHEGTQPVIDLTAHVFEDSLDVTFGSAPVDQVNVELDVTWTQVCPVMTRPFDAEPGELATGAIASEFGGRPRTLTADDFASKWPEPGSSMDGGWTVLGSYLKKRPAGVFARDIPVAVAPPSDPTYTGSTYPVEFMEYEFDGSLVLAGRYEQPRRELVRFSVFSDLQPVASAYSVEQLSLSVAGEDIAPVAPLSVSGSYVAPSSTSDGMSTRTVTNTVQRAALASNRLAAQECFTPVLAAALARAEARLRTAARCIDVEVEVPFEFGTGLNTGSVVRVSDNRIPGGSVTGKVTSVEFEVAETCVCRVKFAASVGRAATASATGATVSDYEGPAEPPVVTHCRTAGMDNGTNSMTSIRVRNSIGAQRAALLTIDVAAEVSRMADFGYRWAQTVDDQAALSALSEALSRVPTELSGSLVSLEAVDETEVQVLCSGGPSVQVVKDIDLEAWH